MADEKKFLPTGTELVTANGTRYTIRRVIAEGGSAIVYEANQEGSLRFFVIKECFPRSRDFGFIRDGVKVIPADSDNENAINYLNRVKVNMERENEVGQLIANATGRTVAPWGKLNVKEIIIDGKTFDTDNLFIVMERVTDDDKRRGIFLTDLLAECAETPNAESPLRNGGNPSPYVATCIVEELLKSLRDIHAAGYIHGDINDGNFFLMGHDFKSGDIGVGQLLDFGSAQKILEDGKTAPIEYLFSTPGYWSPEIFSHKEPVRLTPATDIYSVGCLMLYLFHGMKYKKARGENLAKSKRAPSISPEAAGRHGYRREAAKEFIKILSKAMQYNPADRYQNGGEMLDDIAHLKKLTAPPKFLLAQNLSRSPYFVDGSRDKEIAELQHDMNNGKHPLFIFGVGGIGKTELANEFARYQIANGTPAYLVTFKGTMRETILSLKFSGYESESPGSDSDYQNRIDLLKENYQGCLLIVDNFDDDEKSLQTLINEPEYIEVVTGTGMKILFTTRSRPDESTKELMPFDEVNAMKLFTSISPVAKADEKIVRELIREVDYHPMTIELLAKTREDSWQTISYEELLRRLRYRNADDKNLPNVSIKKNMTNREAKIYGHLQTLFDIYKLGEDYRQVICHVTLLPIDGFNAATFVTNEDDNKKIQLKNLETHSWIRRRKEDNLLTIHPLIRSVFKNELRPTDDDCSDFLKNIWNVIDNCYPPDFELFNQASELFERATNDLQDLRGDFAFYAGFCFLIMGKISSAARYEDKAVKIREVALADNPRELARTYNDAGVAALSHENFQMSADAMLSSDGVFSTVSDDLNKAIDYMNKARKILETLPDIEDLQNLANVCASLAMSYSNREDFDKALPLAQKAVEIFTRYPPENLYEKAHAHQALGQVLLYKKRYAESLEQVKMDATIKEQLIPMAHPELAKTYRELGESYAFADDFVNAETYAKKSLDMLIKIYGENHPDILLCCKLLCSIYLKANRMEDAKRITIKHNEIYLSIHENIWTSKLNRALRLIEAAEEPVDENILKHNPTVAEMLQIEKLRELVKHNRDAAEACRQLKDYDSAVKFINVAIEKISDAITPVEQSMTFFIAAQIFFGQEKFSEALPLAIKALEIMENSAPNNFDKISEQLINLGNIYTKLSDHSSALKSFNRVIEVQGKNPNPENAVIELATRSAAESLMRLGNFDKVVKILDELLTKQRTFLNEENPRIDAVKNLLRLANEGKLSD